MFNRIQRNELRRSDKYLFEIMARLMTLGIPGDRKYFYSHGGQFIRHPWSNKVKDNSYSRQISLFQAFRYRDGPLRNGVTDW